MRLSSLLAATALALLAAPSFANNHKNHNKPAAAQKAEAETAALLDKAIAGEHRSAAAKARDRYRNPKETLLFFGLRPTMTVVEISPSAGWYTDIIAPVLKDRGVFIAAHNNPNGSANAQKQRADYIARLAAAPEVFGKPAVTSFGRQLLGNIAAPGSADMILTFRNVHNWQMAGFAPQAFQAFYTALKPGGILGIEEHRLPENRTEDEKTAKSGYMKQSAVIAMAEAAGFKLVATSEINANPKDTADHPEGVWTLPPNLRLGDKDREKYTAIGESDRMTLKFMKPAR
ncbi:class I SAM-dependent methyltransferase [Sandaracinobacteroides saxicola]|uniref:Class I SAM-dependent methyltransferase n=1 Tax=Sandaracinobacteroides saxicola TaxID=2759707 RepID=A0A7G5IGV1_9SPHN|nr:class I SAM-dependent methyltransferase [Sandaracinobacteroides saxicola]QMW22593.1 class I SAM-dependent methyltransferase [Sandaracinobacteroides saxicola]